MNVLLIGSGGREHTLAWKLKQSPSVENLYLAPGSDAMAQLGETVDIDPGDFKALAAFSKEKGVDLCVPGPEAPLAAGIADVFEQAGIPVFGPKKQGARLESSKDFSKDFMQRHRVATAASKTFDQPGPALEWLQTLDAPYVLKADGLAAGKGVLICQNIEEAQAGLYDLMENKVLGEAGKKVLVEEFMEGEEASLLCFCDGKTIVPMASAQDHKRIGEGDTGPNTGGMGAYSPAPVLDQDMMNLVWDEILHPTLRGFAEDELEFRGCLYVGLMISPGGPRVVEFNVRFGDPEAQVVVPRMDFDLAEVMLATALGRLDEFKNLAWKEEACATVVMASGGYPASYEKGKTITGMDEAGAGGRTVFHAGTRFDQAAQAWKTAGGRVLAVSGLGRDYAEALRAAYKGIEKISFEGAQFRRDIGHRALARSKN